MCFKCGIKFARANTTTEGGISGTVLGMAIVKRYVDIMDGTIEVESELGKGSTFTITIPQRLAEKGDISSSEDYEAHAVEFRGKRILLAEDNELNAEIAMELLHEFGFKVDWVQDGIMCVDKLIEQPPGYYDLILMDIQMPKMNGYEASKAIRQIEDKGKAAVPILALTANAFAEDRKNAMEAGMNGHIGKPIDLGKLIKALSETLR